MNKNDKDLVKFLLDADFTTLLQYYSTVDERTALHGLDVLVQFVAECDKPVGDSDVLDMTEANELLARFML